MKNLSIICAFLTLPSCMAIREQRNMREEIDRMQVQIIEIQKGPMADKGPMASGASNKNLASTSASIDRLTQLQSKMAGDIDLLRRALERGEMPGLEGQKDSVFSKISELEARVRSLENAQKDMIELLEKQSASQVGEKTSHGESKDPNDGKGHKETKASKEATDEPKLVVDPKDSGSKAIKEARVLFTKNKWKQVIEISPAMIENLAKRNEKEELLSIYAESLFKSGDIKEAAIKYNEFLDMKPSKKYVPQATMRMGDCYRHLGDNDTALIYYEELAKSYPNSAQGQKAKERISQIVEKKKTKRG